MLADAVRLEWPELFSLCEVEVGGRQPRWLDMNAPLRELNLDLSHRQHRLQVRQFFISSAFYSPIAYVAVSFQVQSTSDRTRAERRSCGAVGRVASA